MKFYNATTQNNRQIDTVHNHELYTATVSIKHKDDDHIKMKRAKMTSITKTLYPPLLWSVTLTNRQTRKDDFTMKCIIVITAIFEDSVSGVIPVAADKINKFAESGSPHLGVNDMVFAGFLQQ